MSQEYQVVILGLLDGQSAEDVRPRLAALFKLTNDRAGALLDGRPKTIKTGLTETQARKYQVSLEKIGVRCAAQPGGATQASTRGKTATPPNSQGPGKKPAPTSPQPPAPPRSNQGAFPKLELENSEKPRPSLDRKKDNHPKPETSAGSGGEPLRRCQNCGYEAFTSNDPLITAFGGVGECPKCKIIPKRRPEVSEPAQAQPVQPPRPPFPPGFPAPPAEAPATPPPRRKFELTRNMVLFGVVVAVLLAWQVYRMVTKPPAQAAKPQPAAAPSPTASESGAPPAKTSRCLADPGKTTAMVVEGYLPCLFDSSYRPDIQGIYQIGKNNSWAGEGVQVEITRVDYTLTEFPIWEIAKEDHNWFIPQFDQKEPKATVKKYPISFTTTPGEDGLRIGQDMKRVWNMGKYQELGTLSEEEVKGVLENHPHSYRQQKWYGAVRASIELKVVVPVKAEFDGSKPGDLGRTGFCFVGTNGYLLSNRGATMGLPGEDWIRLEMNRDPGQSGLDIFVDAKVNPDWEVTCGTE
jgi:hypothetical protein